MKDASYIPPLPMTDPAAFRPEDIQAVYGDRPKSWFTGLWQFLDPAHILGRGEDFGFKKDHPDRIYMSSIYNFCPLDRDIHKHGARDHRFIRAYQLEMAKEKVQEKIVAGEYVQTYIDLGFLILSDKWHSRNQL